ncbi:MAG TPA: hypothetical protein VMM60_04250 [Ilumatobacter sp.]|nr:hypothetical protein [Ilumatobacter sp.]
MLTLSEPAANLLTQSREQSGIPDHAMLRVSSSADDDGQSRISLGFVDQPMDGDQTTTAHGLGVCIAPEVAAELESAKIDVQQQGDTPALVVVPATG